jgi:GntR family transcriptional regulator
MLILTLLRSGGPPVFRQIVEQVRFQVAAGVLGPGTVLPSTRVLAAQHGLNPMTVSKAFAELEREGLLERRPGQNHVVAGAPTAVDRRAELERALEGAVLAALQLGFAPREAAEVFRLALTRAQDPQHAAPDPLPTGEPDDLATNQTFS